jgi:DNA-binding protein YbaB
VTDQHDRSGDLVGRFTAARGSAQEWDGLVRVEVDGTGDLLALDLDPRAMRYPAADLAEAIRSAFRSARADVQAALQEQLAAQPVRLPGGLDSLATTQRDAERRLGELTDTAQLILDRLGRAN